MDIAVLSNVNIDPLKRYVESAFEGETHSLYFAGYDQYTQELLAPHSTLNTKSFDVIFLFLDGTALFENAFYSPLSMEDDFFDMGRQKAIEILDMLTVFLKEKKTVFILNTLVISPFSILGALDSNSMTSISLLQMGFNTYLIKAKANDMPSNFILMNWQKEVEKVGYENLYDPRFWYLGRVPFKEAGFKLLASLLVQAYRAFLRKTKKVVLLDLDNTLWGGVLGEDGLEGIALSEDGVGKAYRDFQRMLKDTKNKGVLLAIVSKNNLQDVKELWEKHPMVILREEDFVAYRINWIDKAENIQSLADELNLGLDSFVFIDDNPAERERVKNALREVEVLDFPEDAAYLPEWFSTISEKFFNITEVTQEDKKRTRYYKEEKARKSLKDTAVSLEDFYKGLFMSATISLNPTRDYKRISQLTQRTNQFNLTTKRYSESEIRDMIASPRYDVFDISLEDKFGENGIIGVMIVERKGAEAWIDTFLLSCRVIGRTVENAFWQVVATYLKEAGIEKVFAEYIPTRKNGLVETLYSDLGFELEYKDAERTVYLWDLQRKIPRYKFYIKTTFIEDGG